MTIDEKIQQFSERDIVLEGETHSEAQTRIKQKIEKSCLSKVGFSLEGANTIVDEYAQRKEERYYYKCDLCCRYHTTKKNPLDFKGYIGVI